MPRAVLPSGRVRDTNVLHYAVIQGLPSGYTAVPYSQHSMYRPVLSRPENGLWARVLAGPALRLLEEPQGLTSLMAPSASLTVLGQA